MEFENRSPRGSSQHHGNLPACPYFSQSQIRPAPHQPQAFHHHNHHNHHNHHPFGWSMPDQPPVPSSYHHWSASPPATMEVQHSTQTSSSQLRMPPVSGFDDYPFLAGASPQHEYQRQHQQQQHQHQQQEQQPPPASLQAGADADATYRTSSVGMPPSEPPTPASAVAPAEPAGTRPLHQSQNSRLPAQAPTAPSHVLQSPAHLPPSQSSVQAREQTQPLSPSDPPSHQTPSHSGQTHHPQNPPPPNPHSFPPGRTTTQGTPHQPSSGNSSFSSSSATVPSLLAQQHQQTQQQQYPGPTSNPMSNPISHGTPALPSVLSLGRSTQTDSGAQQYSSPPSGQDGREQGHQRQQSQLQSQQTLISGHHHHHHHHQQRAPHPSVGYPSIGGGGAQLSNIPPHLPGLLNPNHLPHPFGHDYHSSYSENIPPIPASQRDIPRAAPPSGGAPTNSSYESRRRNTSSRYSRRGAIHAIPISSERDRDRDGSDSSLSPVSPHSPTENAANSGPNRHGPNSSQLRAAQIFRGSVMTRTVASASAISSLRSVDIESLSETERSCVICYNDFGTETPEGVKEAPLRLPICKHIFGDHCIKKWFEESDSCPYCRTKVPSDLRFVADSRALLELMRSRGGVQPMSYVSPDGELRFVAAPNPTRNETPGSTRRSPPDESGEHRRRIRPRHSGTVSTPRVDGPAGGNTRPSSFGGTSTPSSNNSPPSRDRPGDYHAFRLQEREREWGILRMSRANTRPSQSRVPQNMYSPYPWDMSPLLDPAARLPMPNPAGLPPMSGVSAHNTPQPNSFHRSPAGGQSFQTDQAASFPYPGSSSWRGQRVEEAAGIHNPSLAQPTSDFNPPEANSAMSDADIPMPDRGPAH